MQSTCVTILILILWCSSASSQELSSQQLFGTQWSAEAPAEIVERDIIFPNPTYGMLNFDLSHFSTEQNQKPYFRVVIRNIIAKEIFSNVFDKDIFKQDFGFLDKGTYLLSVENNAGKKLFARRLIIITP